MPRLTYEQLQALALAAIEEAAAASHAGPVPRTRPVALAWLLHFGKGEEQLHRLPSESFWQSLACERRHDRWSSVNAAANAIYLALRFTLD
jgi:hypothetical protein